jgi:hypothetical protein
LLEPLTCGVIVKSRPNYIGGSIAVKSSTYSRVYVVVFTEALDTAQEALRLENDRSSGPCRMTFKRFARMGRDTSSGLELAYVKAVKSLDWT